MFQHLWYLLLVPGLPVGALIFWMHYIVKKREKESRRPFDEMPRPPGYSLQIRSAEILDQFQMDVMMCLVMGFTSWGMHLANMNRWPVLILGLIVCSVFAYRAKSRLYTYANHRLGLLGEQLVGMILDRLSSDSIRVFHDLEIIEPGKKPRNIDHIVLTPSGVYAIETKTRRKPKSTPPAGQPGHIVVYDGQQLIYPAPMRSNRFGLAQAANNATWLSGYLSNLNACNIPVSPVLVLPGWWVEDKGTGSIPVLNPKLLPVHLTGKPVIFSDRQFEALNNQLELHCRINLSPSVTK